jgi:hypothetical protein
MLMVESCRRRLLRAVMIDVNWDGSDWNPKDSKCFIHDNVHLLIDAFSWPC